MDPELAAVNKEIFKGMKTPEAQLTTEGYFACFICDRLLESNQRYGQFKSGSACRFCTILMKEGLYFLGLKKPYTAEQQTEYDQWKLDMGERKGCVWKPRRKTPHPLLAIANSKNITATTGDGTPIPLGLLLTAPDSPLNTPEFIDMFTQIINGTFTGMLPNGTNMTVNGTTTVNNIGNNGKSSSYTVKNGQMQGINPMQMQQLQQLQAQAQAQAQVQRVPRKTTPKVVSKTPKVVSKTPKPRITKPKPSNDSSDDSSDEETSSNTVKKTAVKTAPKKPQVVHSKLPTTIPLKMPPKPLGGYVTKPKSVYVSGPKTTPVKRAPAKKT
jgi:hypothetical protein